MSGRKSGFTISEATRIKMSLAKRGKIPKNIKEFQRAGTLAGTGTHHSIEHKTKIRNAMRGRMPRNINEIKGWNKVNENRILVNKVRKYTNRHFKKENNCSSCNTNDNLQFHHKKYRLLVRRNDFSTVCRDCHSSIHYSIFKRRKK